MTIFKHKKTKKLYTIQKGGFKFLRPVYYAKPYMWLGSEYTSIHVRLEDFIQVAVRQ